MLRYEVEFGTDSEIGGQVWGSVRASVQVTVSADSQEDAISRAQQLIHNLPLDIVNGALMRGCKEAHDDKN